MAQRAGRLTCPKCGANNFDTVSACWKCGAVLNQGATPMSVTQVVTPTGYTPERAQPPPLAYPVGPVQPAGGAYAPQAVSGDPNVAKRAAILLALTIPWIGLPVGWIFMMIEDHRKQSIGRICAAWSVVALLFHIVLMTWATQASIQYLVKFVLPLIQGLSHGGGLGGGGLGGGLPSGSE